MYLSIANDSEGAQGKLSEANSRTLLRTAKRCDPINPTRTYMSFKLVYIIIIIIITILMGAFISIYPNQFTAP